MSLALVIYLLGVVDALMIAIMLVLVGCCVSVVALWMWAYLPYYEDKDRQASALKHTKRSTRLMLGLLAFCVLAPSSKTIAAMYLLPRVVENERVQNIAGDALTVLESYTRKWAADLADAPVEAGK